MLDAPVSGGVPAAADGTLTFICGGTGEAMERARPLLMSMGTKVVHCGEAGTGCTAKARYVQFVPWCVSVAIRRTLFEDGSGDAAGNRPRKVSSNPSNTITWPMVWNLHPFSLLYKRGASLSMFFKIRLNLKLYVLTTGRISLPCVPSENRARCIIMCTVYSSWTTATTTRHVLVQVHCFSREDSTFRWPRVICTGRCSRFPWVPHSVNPHLTKTFTGKAHSFDVATVSFLLYLPPSPNDTGLQQPISRDFDDWGG